MKETPLVLGTAQLGMPYGIANTSGQPDPDTAIRIVSTAWELGIKEYDTAQAYGASERMLGRAAGQLGISGQYRVITKIHPGLDLSGVDDLRRAVLESLTRLGCSKLHGLMLHDECLLADLREGLGERLSLLVEEGLVEKIGISVYSPQRAIEALRSEYIQLVQLPSSILDRRFENAGVFKEAVAEGKELHVRSVFLQGLLLMDSELLPEAMRFARPTLKKFERLAEDLCLSRLSLCLGYARQAYPAARIIFGAETPDQVRENVAAWADLSADLIDVARKIFDETDEKMVNPSLW